MVKNVCFYLLPLGDAKGGHLCGRGVRGGGDGVMLTSENIVVLRASTLCLHSASKLLIFVTSRRKTTLSCFTRSPTDFAYLNQERTHKC